MADNKYGLEPEEWADLKTNFPEYYKNIVIENQQSGGSNGQFAKVKDLNFKGAVTREDSNYLIPFDVDLEVGRRYVIKDLKIHTKYHLLDQQANPTETLEDTFELKAFDFVMPDDDKYIQIYEDQSHDGIRIVSLNIVEGELELSVFCYPTPSNTEEVPFDISAEIITGQGNGFFQPATIVPSVSWAGTYTDNNNGEYFYKVPLFKWMWDDYSRCPICFDSLKIRKTVEQEETVEYTIPINRVLDGSESIDSTRCIMCEDADDGSIYYFTERTDNSGAEAHYEIDGFVLYVPSDAFTMATRALD